MALVSYNRLQLLGGISTGDIWSCTFNFSTNAGEAELSSEAELSAAAARIRALQNGNIVTDECRGFMSTAYTITGFKLATVLASTHRETAQAAVQLAAVVHGTGDPVQAPEIAACVSWNLNSANRHNRGRVFWPGVGRAVTSGLRYLATDTANLAAGMRQTTTDIAGAISGGGTGDGNSGDVGSTSLIVVSKTAGTGTPVSQVSVGDVPDVQRRRRNKEQEAYSVLPIP